MKKGGGKKTRARMKEQIHSRVEGTQNGSNARKMLVSRFQAGTSLAIQEDTEGKEAIPRSVLSK